MQNSEKKDKPGVSWRVITTTIDGSLVTEFKGLSYERQKTIRERLKRENNKRTKAIYELHGRGDS